MGGDTEAAWAAGFWDGEGCSGVYGKRHRPVVGVQQVHRDTLERFQAAVGGGGHVTGPYVRASGRSIFSWRSERASDIFDMAEALAPSLGRIKRAQYFEAMGRWADARPGRSVPTLPEYGPTPEQDLAWAAGFFDAEGSFSSFVPSGRSSAVLSASIGQADPELLRRFADVVRVGYVLGPYDKRTGPMYSFQVSRYDDVHRLAATLGPYLYRHKREQYDNARDRWLDHRPVRKAS